MMVVLEKVSGSLEICASSNMTPAQYQRGTFLAALGIFTVLLILLAALVMAAGNIAPWEEKR